MANDPIEAQLQRRLTYTLKRRDFCRQSEPIVSISFHADSMARECAALRRLCRQALDYFEPEGKPIEEAQWLFDALKTAANGEEVHA